MTLLIAAAAVFVALRLLVAGTPVRDALTARLGEGAYLGLFSLASALALGAMIWGFVLARGGPPDAEWWGATKVTRHIALGLVLLGYLLLVPGLLTPSPTLVGGAGLLEGDSPAKGVLRITRHPFLCGVTLWATAHVLANGDAASLVLFGALLMVGLAGPWSIDAKRARKAGAAWESFRAQTSVVPFAAILQGRQSLKLAEIGWWRIALAVALFALTLWAHPHLFGANPLG